MLPRSPMRVGILVARSKEVDLAGVFDVRDAAYGRSCARAVHAAPELDRVQAGTIYSRTIIRQTEPVAQAHDPFVVRSSTWMRQR